MHMFAGLFVCLSLNNAALGIAVPSVLLLAVYPLAKRYTNVPQLGDNAKFHYHCIKFILNVIEIVNFLHPSSKHQRRHQTGVLQISSDDGDNVCYIGRIHRIHRMHRILGGYPRGGGS